MFNFGRVSLQLLRKATFFSMVLQEFAKDHDDLQSMEKSIFFQQKKWRLEPLVWADHVDVNVFF